MEVKDLKPEDLTNLFASSEVKPSNGASANFGAVKLEGGDLFPTKIASPSTDENTTTISPSIDGTITVAPIEGADILEGTGEKKAVGRKPKYDFTDTSGYFEDRFKTKKFVPIVEVADDGTRKPFIPKTPEDFDEVIDLQIESKLKEERKGLDQKWYQSKTPAWQAVAKYAELTDDPSEIIPFIQGIKTLQTVSDIDETTVEGAERIVRTRLEQRGEPAQIIEKQVAMLKQNNELVPTAKEYKPIILQQEANNTKRLMQEKEQQDVQYNQMVHDIQEGAVKAIEAPIFGKHKLTREEKALVYELIAIPSEEAQGYPIFLAIDSLFQKKDFGTLAQIALLLGKKDSFINYISTSAADKASEGLQRQLRLSTETGGGKDDDNIDEGGDSKQIVRKPQYTGRFSR